MIFNSSFYRKADWEKVGGYKDNYRGWEDYDFWLSLLELGREVIRIPETLYFYRQINTSRSNSMNRQNWVEDYARLFQNHPKLYTQNISTLFQHIVDLREDVHQTHTRLGEALQQLQQSHQQLQQSQQQRLQAEAQLSAILNSKFGRLYTWWGKFKAKLGKG
jgi:hypothetical protein